MQRMFLISFTSILINIIYTDSLGSYYGGYGYNYNPSIRTIPSYGPCSTQTGNGRRATIQLYYEALCPSCKQFDTSVLKQTVQQLGPYLDIHLYPYGNAKTIDNGFGGLEFVSQHGPDETYGNKLHACAIDVLHNMTTAVLFNSCMMDDSLAGSSDDAAADVCGRYMNLNSEAIKQCAKGARGSQLLRYYGDESKRAGFKVVPTILVNGVLSSSDHFKEDVSNALGLPVY